VSEVILSPDNQRSLEAFIAARGRAPRVLHIGNIANNAYNNAKLLNAAGFACDVICYDYYHVMGCPEWEDADFEVGPGDDFRPEWWRVRLGGFERPGWFAQGPLQPCMEYLVARGEGRQKDARRLWNSLALLSGTRTLLGLPLAAVNRAYLAIQRYLRLLRHSESLPLALEARFAMTPRVSTRRRYRRFVAMTLARCIAAVAKRIRRPAAARRRDAAGSAVSRPEELMQAFRRSFPGRADTLSAEDVAPYLRWVSAWRRLFSRYDIVQGYSTDPIWPLIADWPFFAFEHGTLRTIPFQPDPVGRLTALAYSKAEHVFVTNHDCLENAHALAGERVTLINHPFDETHGDLVHGEAAVRRNLVESLDAEFLFFFPTRHDWVPGAGYADKGNDIFIRAFAALRRSGHRVGMVCCEWGANVAQTRALIDALGCANHVHWTRPLGTVAFERMVLATDCVVDQFKLGAFGGVMFKAIAVGRPVCTYLDEPALLRQYPEAPPVVNCRTEDQIVAAFSSLIPDRSALRAIGERARLWMRKHHSGADTVNRQAARYFAYLETSEQGRVDA